MSINSQTSRHQSIDAYADHSISDIDKIKGGTIIYTDVTGS